MVAFIERSGRKSGKKSSGRKKLIKKLLRFKGAAVGLMAAAALLPGCEFNPCGLDGVANNNDAGIQDAADVDVNTNTNDGGTDAYRDARPDVETIKDAEPDVATPEASVPDAEVDSAVVDAEVDSSVSDSSVPDSSIPDAEVDSTAPDASTVVCTGTESENDTLVIWLNQSREIGGFCFWYVNNSPATVNIECNADASCNGGETVRPGIELTVGVPHQEVINGVTITLTVNSATASQLNITIDVSAP